MLLVLVIISILVFLNRQYGFLVSFVSYFCFLLSPWVCAFAKNLYWVEFTWFLPVLISLILCSKQKLFMPSILLFLAVLIKSLCGFEYISVIFATVVCIPIFNYLLKQKDSRSKKIQRIVISISACALGFIVAILIQGSILGQGNLFNGLDQFYKNVVSRRIAGGYSDNIAFQESLQASPFSVLKSYFVWSTDIITGFSGELFCILVCSALLLIILGIILGRKKAWAKLFIFTLIFAADTSWFILASPHSYIHHHMNYILWYFGFVQLCFSIIADAIIFILHSLGLPPPKSKSLRKKSQIIQ